MGDVPALLTTIDLMRADAATLEREGRNNAAKGADRLLASVLRRLCATKAGSGETASAKVELLNSAKRRYRENRDGFLMAAIIDAAMPRDRSLARLPYATLRPRAGVEATAPARGCMLAPAPAAEAARPPTGGPSEAQARSRKLRGAAFAALAGRMAG